MYRIKTFNKISPMGLNRMEPEHYTCSDNGLPDKRLLRTGIYVNLLPEADALRLKQGLYVTGETALRALLEDLGE